MKNTRIYSHALGLLLITGISLLALTALTANAAPDDSWETALRPADIDVAGCRVERAGKVLPVAARDVLAALGLAPGGGWPAGERSRSKETVEIVYTLKFTRPISMGAIMVREARAIEARVAGKWQKLPQNVKTGGAVRMATLPIEFQADALRFRQDYRGWSPLGLSAIRVYRKRLVNMAPAALANAKSEYTAYHQFSAPTHYAAARIPAASGSWINVGLERGQAKITSPPISDVAPTWFMLSWKRPQALSGLHIDSNITELELYEFIGPAGLNPAAATQKEWRKIRGWQEEGPFSGSKAVLGGNWIDQQGWGTFKHKGPIERTVRFEEPVTTRGLKLVILGVESQSHRHTDQVAQIDAMHAYADLGQADVPDFSHDAALPPYTIGYKLDEPGTMTVVVDAPDGTRVRNLVAREWQEAGDQGADWDLKDMSGAVVAPGTYKWKGITGPVPLLTYEITAYPNVRNFHPENTPWRNGHSGTGGWLADHTAPRCVASFGDRVFLGAPVCESGESLIECDPSGKRVWGHGNFAAFTGPSLLAANSHTVYVGTPVKRIPYTTQWREIIFKVDRETRHAKEFINVQSTHERRRGMVGLTASEDHLYVAIRARSEWLVNACGASDVDILNCLPRYPEQKKSNQQFVPDPRNEFLRLLRLIGTPPGQRGSLNRLESSDMPTRRQHILVAFKRPVPVGSLVFPFPRGDYTLTFSVAKESAPYPPDVEKDEQWQPFYEAAAPGRTGIASADKSWTVVPGPADCRTRALRITFDRAVDELDDIAGGDLLGEHAPWKGQIDGLKILRRRYENLFPTAEVRVNSGTITEPAYGTWDAQRTEPLTEDNPAIYALEWKKAQEVRGLAIMELDGNDTRIDVFEGDGPIDIEGKDGWREVAQYEQQRRYYYQPDPNRNGEAIYMDGYVDFGETIRTRAIRLRILSQWTVRKEGRAGLYGIREDRGGMEMNPSRCHVYGVAPLKSLGGDVPVDPMLAERLEVYDARSGKLLNEFPFKAGGKLALAPNGDVYGVSEKKIVKIDLTKGRHELFTDDPVSPDGLAVDRNGTLYVFDRGKGRRNIRVYGTDGTYERSIGKPGGIQMGPWDPERIGLNERTPVDLAIDGRDQLWVVASHSNPKRQSVWTLAGNHLRDHLGNTRYGGGGVLNPWNKRQLFYSAENATLEFELDWETGRTRLKSVPWLGDAPGGELPVQIGDRLYLCTRPRFGIQGCGVVYLYENDRMRPVAALGQATFYPPLRTPQIEQSLGGRALAEMDFVWSDRNGDQAPQVDEVQFNESRFRGVSWFDRELGVQAGKYRFEVSEILENGAPVYTCRQLPNAPANDPGVKLNNKHIMFFQGHSSRGAPAAVSYTPKGRETWRYATEGYGVQAISKAGPWAPAQVVSEFDIIGFDRAHAGDLGDFFVTNSNIGRWNLWTADGLLAGEVMRDRRDPQLLAWSMPECKGGMELPGLTPGSEHFHGYACRIHEDNKYYLVAGHNHISVLEIHGLDRYKRLGGEITVTPEDVRRAQQWERDQQARKVYARAPVYHCYPAKGIVVNADLQDWQGVPALAAEGATFRMAHSPTMLYLSCDTRGLGPFKNRGNDWRRMFKTGAAFDLQMAVVPDADRQQEELIKGDFRLLMTEFQGKPLSVIYQPVAPDAPESEAWETHTLVWRTAFDRVAKLPQVRIAYALKKDGGYVIEAAIPLDAIGLTVHDDLRLPFDWGILATSAGGTEVLKRLYWANKATAILSDEAAEAQITPKLWGHVIFHEKRQNRFGTPGMDLLELDTSGEMTDEDVLDLLED